MNPRVLTKDMYRVLGEVPELARLSRGSQQRVFDACYKQISATDRLLRVMICAFIVVTISLIVEMITAQSFMVTRHHPARSIATALLSWPLLAAYERIWFRRSVRKLRPHFAAYLRGNRASDQLISLPYDTRLTDSHDFALWREKILLIGQAVSEDSSDPSASVDQYEKYETLCAFVCGDEGASVIDTLLDSMACDTHHGIYQPGFDSLKRFPDSLLVDRLVTALPAMIASTPGLASELLSTLWAGEPDSLSPVTAFKARLEQAPEHERLTMTHFVEQTFGLLITDATDAGIETVSKPAFGS